MKEGWEYIPFENGLEPVCKTAKISNSDYLNSGKYPIVSQEDSYISGYWNDDDDVLHLIHPVVVFGDHTRVLKYIDFDFVIGADGVKVLSPISDIEPKFFYYYLRWCNIPSLGYSRHYKLLKELNIPVPPIDQQHRIVSELDLLSSIIEKQKNQLKELDTLAQSIFYDMFGDPVTNEKGWSVKRLESICDNLDYKRKPITASDREVGDIPYYGASGIVDYVKDYIFDGDYLLVSEDGANLEARNTPIAFSISGKTWVNNHAHILRFENKVTQLYIEFFFAAIDISDLLTGAVQPKLTQAKLNNVWVPLPPLPLQQQFAEKIQSIETQKTTISKSIAESEKLFDYTMDKYFG